MGKFVSALDLYKAQRRRFSAMKGDARTLHREMVQEVYRSGRKLITGRPAGLDRPKILRKAGSPFARTRASTGRKRGAVGSRWPSLPIGIVTGQLRSSYRQISSGNSQLVGFFSPGRSINVLLPGGTRRMVDRGYWPEVRKIWRPLNKALLDELRLRGKKEY